MTLKGKSKILRNIIVCLVAVIFMVGVAGVVYSQNNASVKVEFKGDTWNINEEFSQKKWLMNANENEVKFIIDLSDYKIETTSSEGNIGEEPTPPAGLEQPEDSEAGETENPPVEGSEEGNETTDNIEVISENENKPEYVDNGEDINNSENNETTNKIEIKYPELAEVMDINLTTDNSTIVFGKVEISKEVEKEVVDGVESDVFKGKYLVNIPLSKQSDVDESFLVDNDYNINVELLVKENTFGIPVTSDENLPKRFTIIKDVTLPSISISGINEGYSGPVKNININLNDNADMNVNLYKIENDVDISKFSDDIENSKDYSLDVTEFEDGKYKLIVLAKDRAANESEQKIIFNINNGTPTVKFNGEDLKSYYNNKETKITIDIKDGNKIDFNNSKVIIEGPNNFRYTGNFSGENKTVWSDIVTLGEDGEYNVFIKTKDELSSGEVDNLDDIQNFTRIEGTFTLDTKLPEVSILTSDDKNLEEYPKFDDYIYINNSKIKFFVKEDGAGLKSFNAKFEGTLNEEVTDINKELDLQEGNYTVTITSEDNAGNIFVSDPINFIVDKTPIEVKFNEDIKNGEYYNETKKLEITLKDSNLNLSSQNNGIKISKDGGTEEILYFENDKDTFNKDFIDDGTYTITVFSTDKAGNTTTKENKITFTIDKNKPVISMEDYNKLQGLFTNENKTLNIKVKEINLSEDSKINLVYTIPAHKDTVGNKVEAKEEVINLLEKAEYSNGTYTINYVVGENIDWDTIESINYKVEFRVTDKAGNDSILNPTEDSQEGNKVDDLNFVIDKFSPRVSFEGVENNQYFGIIENNEDKSQKNQMEIIVEDTNISEINSIEIKKGNEDYIIEELNWSIDTDNGIAKLPIALIDDGYYKITVNSIDKAGNEVIENNTIEFTIDNEKPEIDISANVLNSQGSLGDTIDNGQYINIEKSQINVTISDTNLNSELSLKDNNSNNFVSIKRTLGTETKDVKEDDGVEVRTYIDENTGLITISADVELEGTYAIIVNSKDKANNVNNASFEFTIDRTNPEVTISNYSNNGKFVGDNQEVIIKVQELNYNDGDIKIELSRQNTDGTLDDSYKKVENANVNGENKYLANTDGKYIYKVTGKDKAGNEVILKNGDEIITDIILTFAIDKITPTIDISGLDRENNHYNSERNLIITVTDDNQSSNKVTLYKSSVEGKEFTEIDTKEFATNKVEITQPTLDNYGTTAKATEYKYKFKADQLNDGCYKIKIESKDIVGKTKTEERIFTIDSKAPIISFNDFNALNGSFRQSFDKVTVNIDETNIAHNDTNMIVSYVKTTPNGLTSEPIAFRQRTNSDSYSKDNDGNSLFADTDAIYTFTVSGKDAATNEAITKTISFTKDATKPEVSITGIEDGEYYNTDKVVKILSNDVNHEINTVTITKDGQPYLVGGFTINGRDAIINHTFSQEGEYVITLYSKDKAGNENTTAKKFTIDKTAPVITPVFKGENRVIKPGEYINKIFTPEFKLDKAEDKFDFITLNEGQNVTAGVPMSSTEMVYHYTGQASDKAGNITKMDITFTVDVTNPEVKVTGIIDGFFSEDMKPEYEITDTNLDNINTLATLNGKEFKSGTKIKEQDYYNLKLLGVDLASNITARNIIFAIDKDKPVIKFVEAMSGKYFTEDFIPNFVIEDLTDYTIISMTLDGVDYEVGDPITEEGKHVLYIEVKDKAENVESISVEFILDKTPPKFIVNGIKNKAIYIEPVTAEITLENPLDKITGITVNGELAKGDVNEENGQQVIKLNFTDINDYEVVLKAVDEAGNETEEVINFKIAKKSIFTTVYANKKIFYPVVISLVVILAVSAITVLRVNKKQQIQDGNSEE